MIIVVDTCELFPDPRLSGPNFEMLRAYVIQTGSQLIVPKIVFEELVNHVRLRMLKHLRESSSQTLDLAKLIGRELADPTMDIEIDTELVKYREQLEQRIEYLGGIIFDADSICVSGLVDRALARRKPFDGDGKRGFRDAVLWETILHLLRESRDKNCKLAFVTSNHKDFGDGGLFKDLCDDIIACERGVECVSLFNGIGRFVECEVQKQLKLLGEVQLDQLRNGRLGHFSVDAFFEQHHREIRSDVADFVEHCDWEELTSQCEVEFESPRLVSLALILDSFEVTHAWILNEHLIVAELQLSVSGEIRCRYKQRDRISSTLSQFASRRSTRRFSGEVFFALQLKLVMDRTAGLVVEFSLVDVDVELGTDWPLVEDD